jgi:hypothetical protein
MAAATLIDHARMRPPVVLAALGLVSGLLTAWLGFDLEPAWLKALGKLFLLDAGMVPAGVFYGVAIALGVWVATGQLLALPLSLLATIYAWSAAISTATGIVTTTSSDVRLVLGSLAAGAVGAGLTHLGAALLVGELRRPRRIATTIAVGAGVGLLYYASERSSLDIRLLFIVWQPAVAYCIGAGLPARDAG